VENVQKEDEGTYVCAVSAQGSVKNVSKRVRVFGEILVHITIYLINLSTQIIIYLCKTYFRPQLSNSFCEY